LIANSGALKLLKLESLSALVDCVKLYIKLQFDVTSRASRHLLL